MEGPKKAPPPPGPREMNRPGSPVHTMQLAAIRIAAAHRRACLAASHLVAGTILRTGLLPLPARDERGEGCGEGFSIASLTPPGIGSPGSGLLYWKRPPLSNPLLQRRRGRRRRLTNGLMEKLRTEAKCPGRKAESWQPGCEFLFVELLCYRSFRNPAFKLVPFGQVPPALLAWAGRIDPGPEAKEQQPELCQIGTNSYASAVMSRSGWLSTFQRSQPPAPE